MLYPMAKLEPETLSAIQELESEIGGPVVALSGIDAKSAELPAEKLAKLQELEAQLGVVLVACRPN